jgi:hypothetical protein
MPKLTKRAVDAAAPIAGRHVWLADGDLPGFFLRILPSGTKIFMLKYKRAGVSRTVTLGRYGPLTPDAARNRARQMLAAVARGEDPARERAQERGALVFGELGRLYLADAQRTLHPKTHEAYASLLRLHVLPKLGNRRAIDIGAADVARAVASTPEFEQSKRERKRVEMLFAHLKRILRLARLRLRRPSGARDEFLLAATAQILRKLAKLVHSVSFGPTLA